MVIYKNNFYICICNVDNKFFQGLNGLLAATDMETIKTYLRWQLIASIPGLRFAQGF